jgi:hypothetical protein
MFVLKPDSSTEITFKIDPYDTEMPTNSAYELIKQAAKAASDTRKSEQELLEYVSHPEVQVRVAVGNNPKMSSAALRLLSKDENKWVRDAVICNHNISATLLEEMFANPQNENLFKSFAKNHVSAKVLKTLSKYDEETVKVNIAKNSYTPIDVLENIAEYEKDTLIILYLLDNKNLTPYGIEKVLDHCSNLNEDGIKYNHNNDILHKVARHRNITDDAVERVINLTKNLRILEDVCKNAFISELSMRRLAKNPLLRRGLISHPKIPMEMLENFDRKDYYDFPSYIMHRVFTRKDLSLKVVRHFIFSDSKSTSQAATNALYKHPLVSVADLVQVLVNQKTVFHFLIDKFFDKNELFPDLCNYVSEEYNIDISEWPKSLIAETLNWKI